MPAVQEVVDQCLAVILIVGLVKAAPYPEPGGVQHDIGVMVRILRHDRWRARHTEKLRCGDRNSIAFSPLL